MLKVNQLTGFGGSEGYRTGAVSFDGSSDYLSRGADLTGNANSAAYLASFWMNLQGGDAANMDIFDTSGGFFRLRRVSTNKINIVAGSASEHNFSSSTSFVASSGWHHVITSGDSGGATLYVDDSSEGSDATALGTTDWTRPDHGVAATITGPSDYYNGFLADLWVDFGTSLDLSSTANRRKFIGSDLKPVYLGHDGSLPTGSAPIVFLRATPGGAASTFLTNQGTGGNFTDQGTLTTASSSPTD
jgi:hypothetical protein